MNNEKKQFGALFENRRKEMNLGLKEVEKATSIRMNYLQAIEEGHMNKLISPVHAQGFIRQYATFLGLDGEKLIKENAGLLQLGLQKQEFSYGIGTMEVRGIQGGGVKWLPNMMWIAIAFLIIIAAWMFAKYLEVF